MSQKLLYSSLEEKLMACALLRGVLGRDAMQEMNLLLIDDERCTLLAFKKLLQSADTQVHTAESLQEASERLNQNIYQVVVSDLRLSGTYGLEGLEILRLAKLKNPETIVILVTAHGNTEIRERAMCMGAAEYFEKPVLAEQIRRVFAGK